MFRPLKHYTIYCTKKIASDEKRIGDFNEEDIS